MSRKKKPTESILRAYKAMTRFLTNLLPLCQWAGCWQLNHRHRDGVRLCLQHHDITVEIVDKFKAYRPETLESNPLNVDAAVEE